MALVAGGIGQTQILVSQRAAPFAIQDFLQFSDVQNSGYTLTDSTDYLAVLYGVGRIYEHPAEHLHVYTAVEHLDQAVIRLSGIWFEEHQRHLSLRREHRRVTLRMRFGKMRADFLCQLLQWQLRMDAPELAYGKTLAIFLHEIELGKRQRGRNLRYFS